MLPVYSHLNYTSTGPGAWISITVDTAPGYPPVMVCTGTGVQYKIEGSQDGVNAIDFSGGGLTGAQSKDLIPGIQYWRTNITVNAGTAFTSAVGPVLNARGGYSQPSLAIAPFDASTGL